TLQNAKPITNQRTGRNPGKKEENGPAGCGVVFLSASQALPVMSLSAEYGKKKDGLHVALDHATCRPE
ncbi:MAG: hypothetical protein RDU20_16525, partial [Desulfomonilaceae bacterium]|nr:hypothetical protein [Desulfomonilaceae bacterium]